MSDALVVWPAWDLPRSRASAEVHAEIEVRAIVVQRGAGVYVTSEDETEVSYPGWVTSLVVFSLVAGLGGVVTLAYALFMSSAMAVPIGFATLALATLLFTIVVKAAPEIDAGAVAKPYLERD